MIQRIKALVEKLNNASDAYYNTGNTIMSDKEFDDMLEELRILEHATHFVMSNSPTQRVGYEVKSKLEKVKHNHPMLSLDKTKSLNDVVRFIGDKTFVAMPKMDGLTCSLRYVDGQLVSAETRGDGEIGESVLHCAKVIKNLPLQIQYQGELIVDGEVIIADADFQAINDSLPDGEKYKNSRNLVSGSIRQLDSAIAAQRNMRFIAWKCITPFMLNGESDNNNSFEWRLEQLYKMGFEVVYSFQERIERLLKLPQYYHKQITDPSVPIQEIVEVIKFWAKEGGYPLDGCVFGYDDIAYGESLGATGHHLRSQLAFKFYDELYPTKLKYIDWTLGKTGILTPTAVFESVEIDGTDVQRASLHNISIIKNLGLTNECTVNVFKANQIVPQIDSCEHDGNGDIEIPTTCPVCGGPTAINKDNESEVLICTNQNCSGKMLARFVHFVSRKCMNIEGLSDATIEFLINKGWLKSFRDIYHLCDHKDRWQLCDGFGKRSVEKILDAIEKSRNVKLENFIAALGIPNIGLSAAKTISKHFDGDFEAFMNAWNLGRTYGNPFDWTNLDDFGEVMANSLNEYLGANLCDIMALACEMHFEVLEAQEVSDNPFNGKSLCVTGKLNHFTRDSINEKILSLGAKAVGSVSKKTGYLITNEASGSSKYKKAVELNIPILTEDEFLKMIGD